MMCYGLNGPINRLFVLSSFMNIAGRALRVLRKQLRQNICEVA
jgi:hypothetical protein